MLRRTTAGLALLTLFAATPVLAAQPPTTRASNAGFDERFRVARSLALEGQYESALAAYSALLADYPDNGDVRVGRGRVHAWMRHWVDAEQDLLAATRVAPRDADAWSALGDVYLWSDQPALAVEAYTRWSELAPQSGEALVARGRAYRAAGNGSAARTDFETAATRGVDTTELLASLSAAAARNSLAGSRSAEVFVPGDYHWIGSLSVDRTQFHGAGMAWTDTVASVRRQWGGVSLGFEALQSQRFGIMDQAFALDGYAPLWSRAYVNARVQFANDGTLFPHNRWRAELFQGVGDGWELSAGYDRLAFTTPVELLSAGVGRYTGPWYLRLRYQHVPAVGTSGSSDGLRGIARWYYRGDSNHYLEINADTGQADPPTTAVPGRFAQHRASVGVTWASLLTDRVGGRLSVSHGQGFESQPYHSTTVSAALYTRW